MKGKPRTHLHALFLKRLQEELTDRGFSVNAFTKRAGAPPQSTMNPIFNGSADPTLGTVAKIADALGIPAWHLFVERSDIANHRPHATISRFPEHQALGHLGNSRSSLTRSDRMKRKV